MTYSTPFTARFGGKCSACGEAIHPGDVIRYPDAHDGTGFEHVDCAAIISPEPMTGDVCPECWLTRSLSGECGCDQ